MTTIDYSSIKEHKVGFVSTLQDVKAWIFQQIDSSSDKGASQRRAQLFMSFINASDLIIDGLTNKTLATKEQIERATNGFLTNSQEKILSEHWLDGADLKIDDEGIKKVEQILSETIEFNINLHLPELARPKAVRQITDIVGVFANYIAQQSTIRASLFPNDANRTITGICVHANSIYHLAITILTTLKNILVMGDDTVTVH